MRERSKRVLVGAAALAAAWGLAMPAQAGFQLGGFTPQVVQSAEGLDNAATFFQTQRVWNDSKPTSVSASFTIATGAATTFPFARLYVDIYGGTNAHTAQVAVTVNGHALSPITVGGTTDANPTFNASQTCVYGSGVGQWQLALAGVAGYLNTDGTPNSVTVVWSDPAGSGFDGRMVDVSLMAVRHDPSISQRLDYFLAEGDGYLRRDYPNPTYGNAPAQRSVAFSGLDTNLVTAASYTALYTHGDLNQADRLFFNGFQLGGNDVAYGQYGAYGPDMPTFDVSGDLASNLSVVYDVSTVGGLTGETSMLAKVGLLTVTHSVPEPAALALLLAGLGAATLLLQKKRRPRV